MENNVYDLNELQKIEKKKKKSVYNHENYLKNKEKIIDYQRNYYLYHKEEILRKSKEKRDAEKTENVAKPKKKYVYKKPPTPRQQIKAFKDKFKGFTFQVRDKILITEIQLPFRIMIEKYGASHCDDKTYNKLQCEIRRRLHPICKEKHLVIIDYKHLQLYTTLTDNLDAIFTEARNFVKEKLAIYGQYYKNNKPCNKDFE